MSTATNQTTSPTGADEFQRALEVAIQNAERIASEKARLEQQATLARQAANEAAAIAREAEAAATAILDKEAKANADLELAHRKKPTPAIETRERAIEIANDLLGAFSSYDNRDRDRRANTDKLLAALWNEVDVANWKTATSDVADDAKGIVMAVEAVCDACAEFARLRSSDYQNSFPADERRRRDDGPVVDVRAIKSPSDSRLVQNLLTELRNVIDGVEPNRKIESVGELFRQNVAPAQISLMLGIVSADGSGLHATLGQIIDRALAKAGFYTDISGTSHLARLGALNLLDAWAIRGMNIEQRREALQSRRGHDGRIGSLPRTEATTLDNESEITPVFRRAVASFEEAAAAKRAALQKKADRYREGLLSDI